LANMSHELRTPLNSLLILSQQLADNPDGNLTPKQVEFAETIRSAGDDLLTLINDILDLSKIESGTTAIDIGQVRFAEIRDEVERTFRQVALQRALEFDVEVDPALPTALWTDATRLQQVLKNLLSNAFKFTDTGGVHLRIGLADGGWSESQETLNRARSVVAFSVRDTGIGIPPEKQSTIFEAFQQADMDTSRRFGGTGLGLSISREIAMLLGGEIGLVSNSNQGSTFTLYIPISLEPVAVVNRPESISSDPQRDLRGRTAPVLNRTPVLPAARAQRSGAVASDGDGPPDDKAPHFDDDRANINAGDRVLLIIEDDAAFARILLAAARERGFLGLVALDGRVGLTLAREYQPDAITLDIQLPELGGWKVLDLLKHDPFTRHIPVHVITANEHQQRALQEGAIAHLQKPVTKETLGAAFDRLIGFVDRDLRSLLVVEDHDIQRNAIISLIADDDVRVVGVQTGAEALQALSDERFDCVVLDLGLPDMTGFELIQRIKNDVDVAVPIVVYTGKELTRAEESELRSLAETIIVKDVKSPERLLDETALFLHRVEARLPESKRKILRDAQRLDPALQGRSVLIIDDDMRNIFALTSALERYGMHISYAENGRDGIEALQSGEPADIVLMDIMMPEMDGFETTQNIRTHDRFANLPIIALTAKAMKGDREKCIEAGASDYITKPVDIDQLISLMRVWLYR